MSRWGAMDPDRYVRREVLGEGGAGRVWLAEDSQRPGTLIAVKELAVEEGQQARHDEALRREFATLARLRHPSVVEAREFDISPDSGSPRFTLEFIQGRNIVEAVRLEGPVLFLRLAVEALRAIAFLHDFEIVHRDLKPANLLVRDSEKLGRRLVIVDLGLALGAEGAPGRAHPTGTVPYMAPELFRNAPATRRSDLYALGATLHEAVYGRPPVVFDGVDLARFVASVAAADRPRLVLPEGLPLGLPGWIEELLAVDPDERPASAVEALARLGQACGLDVPADTPVDRAARLLSGPPTERAEEIARVWNALDPAKGPRLVWLCGAIGSGKSRLLRWLESEAILEGWHVVAAEPGTRMSLGELRALADRRPTLLLVEDADEAGARTAEMLDRLAREPDAPPVQIVAAVRPGVIRQPVLQTLLAGAGTVPTVMRVDLDRLDAGRLRSMARRATGSDVSDERVAWLVEASGGSASAAEALLVDGAWERGGEAQPGGAVVARPEGRLAVLSHGARRWIEALAILRAQASDAQVASLAGLDPASGRSASEEVEAAGLAYRKGGVWYPESRALVAAILAAMPAARRREAHRNAAEAQGGRPAEVADPWLLAQLWAEAGEADRAIRFAVRAATRAEAGGDPAEAAERYAFAVRLTGSDRAARHELRLAQGRALSAAGLYAAAARAFGAAIRLAPSARARGEALCRQAYALAQAGRFRGALGAAEAAARIASSVGAVEHLTQAKKVAGIVLGRLGREAEAIDLLAEARASLRGLDRPAAEAEVVQALAACKLRLGRDDAEADYREAIDLYRRARGERRTGPDAQELKAAIGLAVIRARSGRHDEAAEILETVRADAKTLGHLHLQEVALSRLAAVAIDECRLDRAIALAEQAADLAQRLGDRNLVLVDHARLADARIRCGRAGDAVALLRQELGRSLDQVEPDNVDYARMLLASAWMDTGGADEDAIRALVEQSLEGCRSRHKPRALMMALVIELERRARLAGAEPLDAQVAELEAVIAALGAAVEPEIRVRASLATGAHRLAIGDAAAAREIAETAVEQARRAGFLAYEARARAVGARALERLGEDAVSHEWRSEGRRLLELASARIEDPHARADFLARPVFAPLRQDEAAVVGRERGRLLALYDMIRALNSESDPDSLVETILDTALRALGAERGMILLREDRDGRAVAEFTVRYVRNLESETVRDAESYSRSIVAAAGAGESLLVLDAGSDARFRDLRSVSLFGIRSLMCVPLRSRGRISGTVYLDSRHGGGLFTPDDLRFLEAFADHAALALDNARARARLERRNLELQAAAETRTTFGNIVGRSPGMQRVFDLVEKVAATDLPVLIHGESGTGKELVARAIHFRGPRRKRTFLSENCAAIPESLLESELFGHVRGAFTGADRTRAGLFEQADGGTLFLDEVGDMSAPMQARLLRVLEDGEVRRLGAERPVRVDVRLVAATHRDLRAEVRAGRFREDLLYRLQVLSIEIPPLRDRPGDVALLTRHFVDRIAAERGRPPIEIDDDVLDALERYSWPGNVRELQNALRRLAVHAGHHPISMATLEGDPSLRSALPVQTTPGALAASVRSGEKDQIRRALAAARGRRGQAARILGISRATLYRKMREYGLD